MAFPHFGDGKAIRSYWRCLVFLLWLWKFAAFSWDWKFSKKKMLTSILLIERKSFTLTSLSSDTSTPESPPLPVTWSTRFAFTAKKKKKFHDTNQFSYDNSAVVLTSVPSRSSRRKPLSSERVLSSMPGFWTNWRPSVSVVSPSISLSGSSRPPSTMSLSLVGWPHTLSFWSFVYLDLPR